MLVVCGRYAAAVFVGERQVEEEMPGEPVLQICHAANQEIVDVEHRRLEVCLVYKPEIFCQSLFYFWPYRDAVVVGREMGVVGEVDAVVDERAADGIVVITRFCEQPDLHADESAHLEVVALVFVCQHLASQERRVFVVLVKVKHHAAVDFEIHLCPLSLYGILFDMRTVNHFIMEIERDEAVVAFHRGICYHTADIDISCCKICAKTQIAVPSALRKQAYRTEYQ